VNHSAAVAVVVSEFKTKKEKKIKTLRLFNKERYAFLNDFHVFTVTHCITLK